MSKESCFNFLGLCISNKIDLSLLVSVLIFVAGILISNKIENRKKREERQETERKGESARRRYLIALGEEIGLNVDSLEKAVREFPSIVEISKFLREKNTNRPLITFTFNRTIFQNRTEVLQDLSDIIIRNIVEFYGKLDEICADCESVDYSAFTCISMEGREATFIDIHTQQKVALQQGKSIRDAIAQHLKDTLRVAPKS